MIIEISRRSALTGIAATAAIPAVASPTQDLVVTGDMGTVGERLANSTKVFQGFSVVGIDKKRGPQQDLAVYSPIWAELFAGVTVVHLAWEVVWTHASANELAYQWQSVAATLNVLRACREYKARQLIFCSSYGVATDDDRPEFAYYVAAKKFTETCVRKFSDEAGIRACSVRLAYVPPRSMEQPPNTEKDLARLFDDAIYSRTESGHRYRVIQLNG